MAGVVVSALVQEAMSKGVSFVLGKRKEKSTSQGHIMERLEMAVNELEVAVERSAKLPITDVSLLRRRKIIKSSYVELTELLEKHKPQEVFAGQQQVAEWVKRPPWMFWAKNKSNTPFAGLSMNDVRRFEWYAYCARRFVRDVEFGCSLRQYTFCNSIVKHLLEGKTLRYYHLEEGKLLRDFYIWPVYSDERGVEAVLRYRYKDSTMVEKCFGLVLFLRLSESTDIARVATNGLQLLTSGFNLAAECAMRELTLLSTLQDIAHSYGPPWVGIQEQYINDTHFFRPDPACCKGSRHRLCGNNNVSSDLSDIFPEPVIYWGFQCYYVPKLVEPRSWCSSFDMVGRSKSRGGEKPLLVLTANFGPHRPIEIVKSKSRLEIIGDIKEYRSDASIQQLAVTLKSDAINCFFRQPELTEYKIHWYCKHGVALFVVKKANMEGTGLSPKTRRRCNTRGSTRRSRRR